MAIEVKRLPQTAYIGLRHVGPYTEVGPTFHRVMKWAGQNGLIGPKARMLGLSWDDPASVAPEKLRYDAAISIERRIAVPPEMQLGVLPELTWATTIHRGSYATISQTFAALGQEIAARKDLVAVAFCGLEIYLSPPGTAEADLRTEVALTVAEFP